MEDLYLKIAARLHELVPEIDHIDEDTGQLYPVQEDDRYEYPILFPCLLIDAATVDWKEEQISDTQRGTATVVLKLAFRVDEDTHITSALDNSFGQLHFRKEIESRVVKALHRWKFSKDYSPMLRTQTRSYSQPGRVKVSEIYFRVNVTERLQVGEE